MFIEASGYLYLRPFPDLADTSHDLPISENDRTRSCTALRCLTQMQPIPEFMISLPINAYGEIYVADPTQL